jgi:hypothetical protein
MPDSREWRVGSHYGIHVYARSDRSFHDDPVCTAQTQEAAAQIVADHNAQREIRTPVPESSMAMLRAHRVASWHALTKVMDDLTDAAPVDCE